MMKNNFMYLWLVSIVLISSCTEESVSPRPFGYFRIDLPEASYSKLEFDCPYAFNVSNQAEVHIKDRGKCWINIYYPKNKATLYLTYIPLNNDLKVQLDQTQQLTYEHQIKATRIDRTPIEHDEKEVYGLKYTLDGDVASYLQFYLTDSSKHFIRGALYFEAYVNSDSLRPVIDYMNKDVQQMIDSFEWKESL